MNATSGRARRGLSGLEVERSGRVSEGIRGHVGVVSGHSNRKRVLGNVWYSPASAGGLLSPPEP